MKTKLFSVFLTLSCALFGIIDASAFMAVAPPSAAEGAANVNAGETASAGTGEFGTGVHTNPTANPGAVTDTTRQAAPDLIQDEVDRKIVRMKHSGIPIDQFTRHMSSKQVKGMRYQFYSVDNKPIEATILDRASSDDTSADANAITAKAISASARTGYFYIDNPSVVSVSDTLILLGEKGYPTESATISASSINIPLSLYVESVDGNKITVSAINGKYNDTLRCCGIPKITAGGKIRRLGKAIQEGVMQTSITEIYPTKQELFMQIFKCQVSESTIQQLSAKEVDWTYNDQSDMAIFDMRRGIELSYIAGVKGYRFDTANKRYTYTCAGIIQQILESGNVIYFESDTLTEDNIVKKIVEPAFRGNSGSPTRFLFAGSDMVVNLASAAKGFQKNINSTQIVSHFGYDFRQLSFMSWNLNLYQHPLLDDLGLSHCGFILDMNHVMKIYFRSLTSDALDLKSSGVFDGNSTVWTEISAVVLKYGKTHTFLIGSTGKDSSDNYVYEYAPTMNATQPA